MADDGRTPVDTRKCPWCAEEILAEAKKCKHCGEFLTDDVATSPAQTAVGQDTEDVETSVPDVGSTARGRERRGVVKAAVTILSTVVVTALVLFGVGTLTNVKLGNDATPACLSALAGDKQAIQEQTAGLKDLSLMYTIAAGALKIGTGPSISENAQWAAAQTDYNAFRAQSLKLAPVLSRNRLACLSRS